MACDTELSVKTEEERGFVGAGLDNRITGPSSARAREAQGGHTQFLNFEIGTAERSCGCNVLVIRYFSPVGE